MRVAIAAVTGVLLAALTSVGVVQLANADQKDPVIKPLYNYGSR
ncbi:hypothetical protein GCM10009678_50080 [Actinomadura kijaniata]|uniref:DUF2613 family protein n=1 Tax=Actinomadura namibiensis TaxID=182080 RepID=A0A7W3LNT1_ACTNM|nr:MULTISPECIES: hypothetical protein [Actinomadura]MBA8951519.1 hypothetical protein [Actinomadura namibiensis]